MVSNLPTAAAAYCCLFVLSIAAIIALASQDFDDHEMDFFREDAASTRAPKCIPASRCLTNADCAGEGEGNRRQAGQPWCSGGALVGKCDCGACLGGVPCKDDSKCGGLSGACNNRTKTCNCLMAAQLHYDESDATQKAKFPTLGAAIADFCQNDNCLSSPVGCYGLPCKRGFCVCQ